LTCFTKKNRVISPVSVCFEQTWGIPLGKSNQPMIMMQISPLDSREIANLTHPMSDEKWWITMNCISMANIIVIKYHGESW
jgi:hypothetical protein